ncbi:MAG: hypothetical protein FJ280_04460 [Planctomycetes bacterium]|nr:hypothetical protein [Planctomycetota bacterium]
MRVARGVRWFVLLLLGMALLQGATHAGWFGSSDELERLRRDNDRLWADQQETGRLLAEERLGRSADREVEGTRRNTVTLMGVVLTLMGCAFAAVIFQRLGRDHERPAD